MKRQLALYLALLVLIASPSWLEAHTADRREDASELPKAAGLATPSAYGLSSSPRRNSSSASSGTAGLNSASSAGRRPIPPGRKQNTSKGLAESTTPAAAALGNRHPEKGTPKPRSRRSRRSRRKRSCQDLPAWKDSDEDTCASYEKFNFCTDSGGYGKGWKASWGSFEAFRGPSGITALQACCACGGGTEIASNAGEAHSATGPEGGDEQSSHCVDPPGWVDASGKSCAAYKAENRCIKEEAPAGGLPSAEVCCHCKPPADDRSNANEVELPPSPPVRRTRAGCECLQTWSDEELGTCDKACCNLDNDESGDWCVIANPDCQLGVEWGYCLPLDVPAKPVYGQAFHVEDSLEWKVVVGKCEQDIGGCITNPVLTDEERAADPHHLCVIAVPRQGRKFIEVSSFELGEGEMLRVNGKDYVGAEGPHGVLPNGMIWWTSDNNHGQLGGWKICPKAFPRSSGRWTTYDYACSPKHGAHVLPLPGRVGDAQAEVLGLTRDDCRELCLETAGCAAVTFWSQNPTRCLGISKVTARSCHVNAERSVSTDIFVPTARALRLAPTAQNLEELWMRPVAVLDAAMAIAAAISLWCTWRRLCTQEGCAGISLHRCGCFSGRRSPKIKNCAA